MRKIFIFMLALFLVFPSLTLAQSESTEPVTKELDLLNEEPMELADDGSFNGSASINGENFTFTEVVEDGVKVITIKGENSPVEVITIDETTGEIIINDKKLEEERVEEFRDFMTPFSADPGGGGGGKWTYVNTSNGTINVLGLSGGALATLLTATALISVPAAVAIGIAATILGNITDSATTITYKRYKYRAHSTGWKHFKYVCSFFYGSKFLATHTWEVSRNF